MSQYLSFMFSLLALILSLRAEAEPSAGRDCIVHSDGRKDIAQSFHQSQEKPVRDFFEQHDSSKGDGALRRPKELINTTCLVASLRRTVGRQGGFSCAAPDGSGASANNSARSLPGGKQCITSDMLRYIQSSLSSAMNCVSEASRIPVDAATTYQKINNESAFQFYHSNSGGTGIGQLTSWPLRDMFQARPGLYADTLSKIESLPQCSPFKAIVESDRQLSGAALFPRQRMCRYLSPGEGFQRNLLYSMVFMSQLKKRILNLLPQNFLQGSSGRDIEKQKRILLIERLALVGYGPEGMARAQGLARSLRFGSEFNVDTALRRVTGGSSYLRAMDSKSREALRTTSFKDVSECVVPGLGPSSRPPSTSPLPAAGRS